MRGAPRCRGLAARVSNRWRQADSPGACRCTWLQNVGARAPRPARRSRPLQGARQSQKAAPGQFGATDAAEHQQLSPLAFAAPTTAEQRFPGYRPWLGGTVRARGYAPTIVEVLNPAFNRISRTLPTSLGRGMQPCVGPLAERKAFRIARFRHGAKSCGATMPLNRLVAAGGLAAVLEVVLEVPGAQRWCLAPVRAASVTARWC